MRRLRQVEVYYGTAAERAVNFPVKIDGTVFLEEGGAAYMIVNGAWVQYSPASLALLLTGGTLTGPVDSASTISAERLLTNLLDRNIGTHADDTHFDTVLATYPTGWTEVTPAASNDVSTTLASFWRIHLTSAETSFGYRVATTVDFENDVATDGWHSWTFGPILSPRDIWTAPVGYYFSVHGGDGGYQSNVYNRVRLYWDNTQERYTLRGEYSDGTNSGNSTALVAGFPLAPLYARIAMQNSTAQTFRAYVGTSPEPNAMHLLYEVDPVAPATYATAHYRIGGFRGTGPDSQLFIGAIVSQSGIG